MAEDWLIEDKSFIITGGANSLGAAYVEAFLKEGAKNIAILDVDNEAGATLSKTLNEIYGNKTIFVKCDVSVDEEIAQKFQDVLNEFKQVDVIINNAGVMNDSEQIWRKACDINWQGVASLTRKGVSHMRKDEGGTGGTIVNVSSIAGFLKYPIMPAYAGSKAAVLHFSTSLAHPPFHEKTGVRILTICFGPTKTTLMKELVAKSINKEEASKVNELFPFSSYQEVRSAVDAMVKMFKIGCNGSVWLSSGDREAEDITHIIDKAHEELLNVMQNGLKPTEEKRE